MDRDDFLARVGRAGRTAVLPPSPAPAGPDSGRADGTALLDLFRERAEAVNAVVHGPVPRGAVPSLVHEIAAESGASSFMAWDVPEVVDVAGALSGAGLERVDHRVPAEGRLEHQAAYGTLDLGVTGAIIGLAESGSVVLSHGPGRPRMASLIPETHVVVLEADSLASGLSSWASQSPEAADETSNLVMVTGPSRTGDIEQQLNLGVHGPRHVHVVLVA